MSRSEIRIDNDGDVEKLSLSFVVPRFGPEIRGGAETAVRFLASSLLRLGCAQVEILTTTAKDMNTWENYYPSGNEDFEGLSVRRFSVDSGRIPNFDAATARMLARARSTTMAEAVHFTELQGPVSMGLIDAIANSTADAVIFYPYLYNCTTAGIANCPTVRVLHPAAHEEPVLDLVLYDTVFGLADGIVYQTSAEKNIVETRFNISQKPSLLLGMGVDPNPVTPGNIVERLGLMQSDFILCLGRVDVAKGTTLLAELFLEYKTRNPTGLKLVIAGPISVLPPSGADIIILGEISDGDKFDLISNAKVIVSPSLHESFSLVLLEAWNLNKPVLVNQMCAATTEQVTLSGGGLYFSNYETFEVSLTRLLQDSDLARSLGKNGANYVESRFSWVNLTNRYFEFLLSLVRKAEGLGVGKNDFGQGHAKS